ncbi:SWIM zinc finger family protein [Streptomyces sp. NPDC086787]|uniref:SWIM zinc finger family protein n=1 Tax=Streptomyces sp. NPDC086787 TaxID=3365759 RepID=UPI0037F97746
MTEDSEETTRETAGQPRPGDAARRALRDARDRAAGEEDGERLPSGGVTAGTAGTAGTPTDGGTRPGDVARAALRSAVSARRAGDDTTVSDDRPSGGAVPDDRPSGGAARTGTRPGDSARKALRAARRDTGSGPTPAPSRTGATVDRAQAARDIRRFLANAFRMPPETDDMPPEADGPKAGPDGTDLERSVTAPKGPSVAAPETSPEVPPDAPREVSPEATPVVPPEVPFVPPPVARTMATPHRDGELRRTFPPFAPRTPEADAGFADTWWGNAWVDALEGGALDANRLARGRGYAAGGHVDAITVTPGLVLAYVRGSRPRPYRVQVRLRTFADADWDRLLDTAADRPGDIAALLDKELPQTLADCGVPLLPGPGDLEPRCSCPDSGHPCKHAAALCYQTARLLDADPFVLLLLRGRGERELLDTLSRLSAARAARAAREQGPAALPGVRAADALAPRRLPPLPSPLPLPAHPEQPPVYPAAPGGPDPFALDQLATDAAARAHALHATGSDPVGELTLWQDAVRLAAARPGSGLTAATRALYAALATATGRTTPELARAVAAWRQGGLDGLAALEDSWDPPAGRFDRARPLLLAADLPAFRPWRNRLTHPAGHIQLRLGQDGLWYPYESEPGHDDWWPRGTPDLDPVGALTGLGRPDSD